MCCSLFLGYLAASDHPAMGRDLENQYISSASTRILHSYGTETLSYFAVILTNNLFIACLFLFPVRMLVGRTVVLSPVLIVLLVGYNSLLIGAVMYLGVVRMGWEIALAAVLPHGILELSAMVIAAALGLTYACRSMQDENNRVREFGRYASAFIAVVVPLVVSAACIEVFVTRALIGTLG